MSVKPKDVVVHREGMPGKDGTEGLVELVAEGQVAGYNWEGAFGQAKDNFKNSAAKLGVRDVYYFKQTSERPSDDSYGVTVAGWYDPNTIEEN